MNGKELGKRLGKARVELDECAEWLGRLIKDVEAADSPRPELLGLTEISELTDTNYKLVQQRYRRGLLPEPVALLACGPIWLKQDIVSYSKRKAAA